MKLNLRSPRKLVAALAVTALVQGVGATALAPVAAAHSSSVTATSTVNIRAAATTSSARVGVLHRGDRIASNSSRNGWTTVTHRGGTAYIASAYLTNKSGVAAKPSKSSKGKVSTTANLNLRTGPSLSRSVSRVVPGGTRLSLTGSVKGSYSQVRHGSSTLWAATSYLRSTNSGATKGKSGKVGNLNRGGSSGLNKANANTKKIARHVWATQPDIKTMFGVRRGSGDHPAGRAVDVMIPSYKSNNAVGWKIARYYRANAREFGISYIIFDQQIWSVGRNSEGWRKMSGRGGDTANHKDHVHINT